jgi:hypothetical protein
MYSVLSAPDERPLYTCRGRTVAHDARLISNSHRVAGMSEKEEGKRMEIAVDPKPQLKGKSFYLSLLSYG